ncbi:MAG: T9SS type A sorting domain-containing protein [Bacteroidales bacterium]|nr:T9SS type A sorting domain-containing protein [Bacteroidales bacterium]
MKRIAKIMIIIYCLNTGINIGTEAQKVYYTGNGGSWDNWDLYSYDLGTTTETRLTFNTAIDNHPDISHIDPNRVVFSSNRGNGEFDIYVGNTANVDGTAVRLTFDAYPGSALQGKYPDRHPHWHTNGELIVFTSKNRGVFGPFALKTECSSPIIIIDWRYFEGMNVLWINAANTVLGYFPLNVRKAWDSINDPTIWVHNDETYVGHPSFNSAGDKMVFTAAIDGEGKVWEVYTCGFDPVSKSLIPNSLERKTLGPNNGNNPIKMSGGAKFSDDDTQILFNSTRITSGNSQIYSIPATAIDWPVTSAARLTFHQGNDYVPQPVPGSSAILITSDLGPVPLCGCELGMGATADLDVVLLNGGARTILGTDASQQTLLLGDEVSWFCGLKPNLSACTFTPRVMSVEALWLEHEPYLLPPNILEGYGPNYINTGQQLYSMAWNNLQSYMYAVAPMQFFNLIEDISMLASTFPGWTDPIMLRNWYMANTELRIKKYVVPSVMHDYGLGGIPFQFTPYNNYLTNILVPDLCDVCHDGLDMVVTGGNGSLFTKQPGGKVDLIAGVKILLLPGTTLKVSGDRTFTAKISPTGLFCPGSLPPGAPLAKLGLTETPDGTSLVEKLVFKVYPNPTSQSFWIELPKNEASGNIQIEVYDLTGLKIFNQTRMIDKRTQVTLPGKASGIYFVRLTIGNASGDQIVVLN